MKEFQKALNLILVFICLDKVTNFVPVLRPIYMVFLIIVLLYFTGKELRKRYKEMQDW